MTDWQFVAQAVKWDPTISLGVIIAGAGVILTIMGVAWKFNTEIKITMNRHGDHIAQLLTDVSDLKALKPVASQVSDIRDEIKTMQPKVDQILHLNVLSEDLNRRLTRLEDERFGKQHG